MIFIALVEKKNIHIGLDRALFSFSEYSSIIKDFEQLLFLNKMDDEFEFVKLLLNHSVKWRYNYIIFRKIKPTSFFFDSESYFKHLLLWKNVKKDELLQPRHYKTEKTFAR